MRDYRAELFATYAEHTAGLDPDAAIKERWFLDYATRNYLHHMPSERGSASLLDIGCNRGYLLAGLRELGFAKLHGVDASQAEIDIAKKRLPGVELSCSDAGEYLAAHVGEFDVIVMKAVLEHIPKDQVLPLLRAIRQALRPQGVAIIDVPNMDWLYATHERYMDFTHEAGFTRESIQQLLSLEFGSVRTFTVDNLAGSRGNVRRRFARAVLGTLLKWADPEGGANSIWDRSLIAVARPE